MLRERPSPCFSQLITSEGTTSACAAPSSSCVASMAGARALELFRSIRGWSLRTGLTSVGSSNERNPTAAASVSMRRGAQLLALCTAAALLCAQQACALESSKQITLDAGGCQGVEWNRLVSLRHYFACKSSERQIPRAEHGNLRFFALDLAQGTCSLLADRARSMATQPSSRRSPCRRVVSRAKCACPSSMSRYGTGIGWSMAANFCINDYVSPI